MPISSPFPLEPKNRAPLARFGLAAHLKERILAAQLGTSAPRVQNIQL